MNRVLSLEESILCCAPPLVDLLVFGLPVLVAGGNRRDCTIPLLLQNRCLMSAGRYVHLQLPNFLLQDVIDRGRLIQTSSELSIRASPLFELMGSCDTFETFCLMRLCRCVKQSLQLECLTLLLAVPQLFGRLLVTQLEQLQL